MKAHLTDLAAHLRHAKAMLLIDDISYSIAGRHLIVHASTSIPDDHKVGIVRRNRTGKATLFRRIRGELALETGRITLASQTRIGASPRASRAKARPAKADHNGLRLALSPGTSHSAPLSSCWKYPRGGVGGQRPPTWSDLRSKFDIPPKKEPLRNRSGS